MKKHIPNESAQILLQRLDVIIDMYSAGSLVHRIILLQTMQLEMSEK